MSKRKSKNNLNKGLKIIDQIQNIRSKNNKNWMDLLRLSLKLDYKKTAKIIKDINHKDKKISDLANQIYRLKD